MTERLRAQFKNKTLVICSRNGGFFSNFNCVLNNLERHLGKGGVSAAEVSWPAQRDLVHFSYGRPEDGNIWLHFFEPLAFPEFPPTRVEVREYATWGATQITAIDAYATYKLNWRWRRIYHRLFTKHIKIKSFLLDRVEAIARDRMAGRFCIGVHYRNPRHTSECPHTIPTAEEFVARVRDLTPKRKPTAVVLASDFEPAVELFRKAFGEALVVQPDVTRAASLATDQMHHGVVAPAICLGEQVLIDCLLLARCDVLLHVTSNVATAAGYINPKLRMVYCETPAEAWRGYRWAARRWWELKRVSLRARAKLARDAIAKLWRRARRARPLSGPSG